MDGYYNGCCQTGCEGGMYKNCLKSLTADYRTVCIDFADPVTTMKETAWLSSYGVRLLILDSRFKSCSDCLLAKSCFLVAPSLIPLPSL